ncbi:MULTISPECIES: autotransporter domain-containing protein [unclassified Sphingomonas]|uniref:autotransporter domain-containing protein n=1 Tax=unclassified Sphingomonas TaxID=196159 RepID=UPI00226A0065|nr:MULTISPECIES: autotransporter domain-containing protein [unclassified Sphingomonas]
MKNNLRNGASRIATSWMLTPMAMIGAGVLTAPPAHAQLLCVPEAGINIMCGTSPDPVTPGAAVPTAPAPIIGPAVVTLVAGLNSNAGIDLTTIGTAADLTLTPVTTAVVNSVDQPALALTSGGGINARVTSLTTNGTGATGAVLRAVDTVLFTVDDLVSTAGDNAPGVDAQGGSVAVNAGDIITTGNNSNGAQLLAISGPALLNADLIDTSGNLSTAALVRAAGDVDVDVGVLRTSGGQALGLNVATDPAACVLLGNGGCSVTAAADQITTNGFGGIGALITAAAPVALNVGVLQTNGDQAAGINLLADPTICATLGAGACDANFTVGNLVTNGANSPGALIRAAGNVTGSVDVLQTNGANAIGLDLASDPDACVLLGAGNCGTSFDVGQLTTSGAGATGVLARVVGPTTGRIGLLETGGDNANGIDIAADPAACVLLGSGACDIDLAADQVSTTGDGALGVVINAPARILANLGAVSTSGDNATAVRIITDPAVCLVLGPGSCAADVATGPITTGGDGSDGVDVNGGGDPVTVGTGDVSTGGDDADGVDVSGSGPITVSTGNVTTGGNGSTGVIVDGGAGPIIVTTGDVTTAGNDSPGVDVSGDGTINVTTGDVTTGGDRSTGVIVDGGAGDIVVSTGNVSTTGAGSTGVDVAGAGPIAVTTGDVTTGGDGATGLAIGGGGGPITLTFGNVVTTGDDAPGANVAGTGAITVSGSSVTTSGARSDGLGITGGIGPVAVTVGPVVTNGDDANGITVATTDGAQTIFAGPVTVTGLGSNAIVATGTGCSAVSITASGAVSATQGTAIAASSACGVAVTTLAGAPVSGQAAGIAVTSGTGSTIAIADVVQAAAGPAISANGAATTITVGQSGQINGYVDLTAGDDTLINNGVFEAVGDSAFGDGVDTLVNNGLFTVRRRATTAGAVTLAGLETFTNAGLVDLRNGVAGDTLTVPGSFVGNSGSALGLDVSVTAAGATADKLVIGGAATGSTQISLQSLASNPGVLVNNLVVVDAGAGSTAGAFSLAGGTIVDGLIGYSLVFDPAAATYGLYGTPTGQAYEFVKLGSGAREVFYRGSDAVSGHLQTVRDATAGSGDEPRRGSALWGQMYGSVDRDHASQTFTAFGQPVDADLAHSQDYYGGQFGLDLGSFGFKGTVLGITGGYTNSTLSFAATADRFGYQAVNGGIYAGIEAGPFFLNALGKYEHYWIDVRMPSVGIRQKIDGHGYGGMAQAGLRFGSDRFFAEPSVSVDYVRSSIDQVVAAPTTLDFADADGLRGRAGLRLGSKMINGATATNIYVKGEAIHEFRGRDAVSFGNGGYDLNFANQRLGTYGRGTVGVTIDSGARVAGFLEAFGDAGDDYKGGGGRAGLSVRF